MPQVPLSHSLIDSPLGQLRLSHRRGKLYGVDFLTDTEVGQQEMAAPGSIGRDFMTYFSDPCHYFTTPVEVLGSAFQQRLWQALRQIPPGETRTYGELAQRLGSSPRAVGNACRANPCPIIIPCHRVVAKQGLGGYAGATAGPRLQIKRWLLRHEGVNID